ncbi:MAG: hypothetical protein U0791_11760 [Gemmataceae bacterium]
MTRPLTAALLFLLLAAFPAVAQDARPEERKQPTVPADGTEVLQYLLDRAKLKPVKANEVWNLGPARDTVVIVLGSTTSNLRNGGPHPLQLAANNINSGGAALIASDTRTLLTNFPNGAESRIPNGQVRRANRTQPASLFLPRNSDNMPFVEPLDPPPGPGGPEWELFNGLGRIATNRPSFLLAPNPRGEFASRLASYPEDCDFADINAGDSGRIDHRRHFFAVGSSGRHLADPRWRYRFLVLADPSVFINQMMLASDDAGRTDNLEFAARVVAYLAEREDGGRRTRCLLIQNGEVIEDFGTLRGMMQPPLPLPNIMAMQDKLTDFGNKILDHFQTNDTSNKMLLGTEEEKRERNFLGILKYVVCTLILIRLVWYVLKRAWVAKRPADGPPPQSGGLPPPPKKSKPRGVFDRREKELLRRNNLYEPVRMIVRDMFLAAGAPEEPGKRLPEVEISDVVHLPDTLVDALTDLWKIAFGPARVVTVQRWKLLEPLFERVRQAHADGKWRFVRE